MSRNDSLDNLANLMFQLDPKPPCSIQVNIRTTNTKDAFEYLKKLLFIGIVRIIGDMDINDIDEPELEIIKPYFWSIGKTIQFDKNNRNIEFKEYDHNISVAADTLFREPPREPFTVGINFGTLNRQQWFNQLHKLFHKGIKIRRY